MGTSSNDPRAGCAGLGGPALRTFFNIAKSWELSDEEQMKVLGLRSTSTLRSWRSGRVQNLRRDTLERISYMLGIYKAINILLPDPKRAREWMRRPNGWAILGGGSALDRMTAGNVGDLYVVRQYLDAELVR
jgi:hypothetical protein